MGFPHKHTDDTFGSGAWAEVIGITGNVPVLRTVIDEVDAWYEKNRKVVKRLSK